MSSSFCKMSGSRLNVTREVPHFSAHSQRRRWLLFVIVAIAISFALSVWNIFTTGLWIDELYTLHAIRLPMQEMLLERWRRGHPPLYFLFEKFVYGALADSSLPLEAKLRLLSLVFWFLAVVVQVILSFRLLPSPVAAVSSIIVATSTNGLMQAANARMYTLVLLAAVCWTHAWILLRRGASPYAKALLIFAAIVGCGASPTFLILLGMAAIYAIWKRSNTKLMVLALCAGLLVLLPGFIAYAITPHQMGPAAKNPARLLGGMLTLLSGIGTGKLPESAIPRLISACGYLLGGLAAAGLIIRLGKHRLPHWLPVQVVWLLLLYVLANALLKIHPATSRFVIGSDRYVCAFIPVGAVVGAYGLLHFSRSPRRTIIPLMGCLAVLSWLWLLVTPIKENRVFAHTMKELRTVYRAGQAILATPQEIRDGLELLLPEARVIGTLPVFCPNQAEIERVVELASKEDGVWLIAYRAHCPALVRTIVSRWGEPQLLLRGELEKRDTTLLVAFFEPRPAR
ncbi:MAG: hypothetical protein KatS3mg130_0732 [Candidatus Sumerlaea sp.]|nr:MAG: hypothetical protein KatS3mg130_0732 [Candidatus Sumerlaea sp.]